jgi:uncharacterized small protein (DUF1192 family)
VAFGISGAFWDIFTNLLVDRGERCPHLRTGRHRGNTLRAPNRLAGRSVHDIDHAGNASVIVAPAPPVHAGCGPGPALRRPILPRNARSFIMKGEPKGRTAAREGWEMTGFGEEDRPRPKTAHEIGQDLTLLSLEEIDRRIALLKEEILRLEASRAGKQASRAAADSFFKR